MYFKRFILYCLIFLLVSQAKSQISLGDPNTLVDYTKPADYVIGGITVYGTQNFDHNVIIMLSGLAVGDMISIPGEQISKAIDNIWKQGLFENIKISASNIINNTIFLDIYVSERPRLSKFSFKGIRKSEADNIRDEINITRGDPVNKNMLFRIKDKSQQYFIDKGFLNTQVDIKQSSDTLNDGIDLEIIIDKNSRVKVRKINIFGNNNFDATKIKRTLKNTKEKKIYRLFKTSRYIEEDYKSDKNKLLEAYNELGFRDAAIISDSIYIIDSKHIDVNLHISEGVKYYFGNITWVGNTKYSDSELNDVLRIKKGDIYNQKLLETNLYMNMEGRDVSSLYLDDGYLFFNVNPVEINVDSDSIDLEIRINEGKQATINKVTIKGNTKTSDHVIMREIRTKPGQLFSRADIIRTQRELAQLRYFDQEKMDVNPIPNPIDGTVDLEYIVEETSSDQVELSAGWGVGTIVGTLGLSFNNFSGRNIFKKGGWTPIPSGDGQRISIRAQSNGPTYQSYNAAFVEPWFGGKKPNSLSFSVYHSMQTNGYKKEESDYASIRITGIALGYGKRLQWPDDYFTLMTDLSYQYYQLKNYSSTFAFSDGYSNNISATLTLARNSIDAPIFPRSGSEVSFMAQSTLPYSLINNRDYSVLSSQEKFKWLEYHKYKVSTSLYTKLAGKLVMNTRVRFGFLGLFNKDLGIAPFERFYLGGDGLSGFALDGRELIGLRGYSNNSVTPRSNSNYIGGTIFNKYTMELRYLVSPSPMATIYVLGFIEAGNTWLKFSEFNPLDVKRSFGIGVRINLPMFGLLGLDYGYGIDEIPGLPNVNKGQFHFSINQSIE